jgi:signal transduction histidine kinase
MMFFSYLSLNRSTLCFFALVVAIANFFMLTSINIEKSLGDILYFNILVGIFALMYSLWHYRKWIQKYKPLRQALDSGECINTAMPEAKDFYSELLKDIVVSKNTETEIKVSTYKKNIDEMNDYITKWVHEIKTPISVTELILERIDDFALINELQMEIERMKFLSNQVLYISRASSYGEDFTVREFDLNKLIKDSIKRNSTLLISKNIEIYLANLDFTVLSDEKWIAYIIDQLLNNSYKYLNPGGKIEIGAERDLQNNIQLSIRDNGVGILAKDISRVFEKSFTGNNQFNLSKSTGMGLYISKKMLDKLRHRIEVRSEPGVFTEFTIYFFRISDYKYVIVG